MISEQEAIDTMMKCFSNVLKWSRIERTDSLDDVSKSTIKEHMMNMYGIQVLIWNYQSDTKVTYRLQGTTGSLKSHSIDVEVTYTKYTYGHFFKPDTYKYEAIIIKCVDHHRVFTYFEEELEYHLDAYFLEDVNRTQLLHVNLNDSERPLEDRVAYSIDSPKIVQNPDPNTIPDADTRMLLFIYYVKHKETGKSYRIMVDCILDCQAFIPILKYRRVTVTTGKPTMEKR